ncbi:MAG: hypothetical protein KF878_13550 [Planctomycetes bacterium]|nr:hypothetical protein [Planctomycetota bacterium]
MTRPFSGVRAAAVALAPLLLLAQGCSFDRMAADTMAPVLLRTKDNFNRESVPRFAREAGPGLLVTLDGMVLASPRNVELRLLQAEMNAAFAFGFLEREDPVWATSLYRKARAAAAAALAEEDDDLAAALAQGDQARLRALLADADEDALPALFWWAFARGAEVNLNRGDTTQVAALATVDLVMGWVLGRDERFYNGGPHLYFALRHLALPPSFGGKPQEGLKHFEAVERITGGKLLMARVLRAQFHAPTLAATPAGTPIAQVLEAQKAAWAAYHDPLAAVLGAPDDLWPEQALPNAVAKVRARELLQDPEGNNIITPPGVTNAYKKEPAADGGWGDEGDGAWGDSAGPVQDR